MAYTLGNTYTMAAFTGSGTQTQAVTFAAGQVCRIQITVPNNKYVTAFSTSTTGSNVDTYGYLCDGATSTFSSRTPQGVTTLKSDDDSQGNRQWKITYQNTTGSTATWYIYHMGYSDTTTDSNTITVSVSDPWTMGTTYTMPAFTNTADGTYTNSVAFSTAAATVSKITVTIPAFSQMTFYSAAASNADMYGYLSTSSSATVNAQTGVISSYTVQDDNSQGNNQWKLTYDNSTNTNSVTMYIYSRATTGGTATSGTIYAQAVIRELQWAIGSTSTLNGSGAVGIYTSSQYTINVEKVNRYSFSVPARSYFKVHSEFPYDTVGYIGESAVAVNAGTGAPDPYVSTDDNSYPIGTSQFELTYMNKTNSSKTIYIYVRFKSITATGSGRLVYEISQAASLPAAGGKTSVIKRYTGSAWETVYS